MSSRAATAERPNARSKLIDAAHALVRKNGYSATSVDEICAAAGVTKGAFFHHFASKEALAVAAAEQWTARADEHIFTLPDWTRIEDPLERLLAHIDFRAAMMNGPAEDFTCFVGTMVQESFASSDVLRRASDASITAYAERLAEDIEAAIANYRIGDRIDALSLAYHVQAVLQGAFILAKAKADPGIARDSVTHLKRYVQMLFNQPSHAIVDPAAKEQS
jgi:TetR/AcrR family transcriptional regulator, transcriptional repressor for nem operon